MSTGQPRSDHAGPLSMSTRDTSMCLKDLSMLFLGELSPHPLQITKMCFKGKLRS